MKFYQRVVDGFLLTIALAFSATASAALYHIAAGPERSTAMQIGRDLSTFAAASKNLDFDALVSTGSAENVKRLFPIKACC
jgi:TRAP-type uncharacterized transport system substrate-binding protein